MFSMLPRNLFFSGVIFVSVVGTGLSSVPVPSADVPRAWEANAFLPLTESRIDVLPESEQAVWRKYVAVSRQIARAVSVPKESELALVKPLEVAPHTGGSYSKGLKEIAAGKSYSTHAAQVLADNVVSWQAASGGWTKSNDYSTARPAGKQAVSDVWGRGTFDNDATITELRYLAQVIQAASDAKRAAAWKESFLRGLQYIFNAQYPNGGYPQIYPLVGGYHDAITYNDNAMEHVLELLADVAAAGNGFVFVTAGQRAEAGRRLALGIECVLKTQIVEPSGRRTVWGQQHDMLTLKPCAARNFEPIAATVSESVSLVRFLMKLPIKEPSVESAVADATAWLEKVALRDVVWDRSTLPSKLVRSSGAGALWARFYEIGTDKPVFGDRDRMIYYEVGEISAERQKGYAWFGNWASSTLAAYKKR